MLIEKEIIRPGCYWYTDEKTGLPRKLDVTPELTKYWHEQGSMMLSAGLTVPVPYEHDFSAHPMTPKDKLLNNAGEVKEYRLRGNTLFGVVDVQDDEAKKKIGKSIRWTSPWINSFTDGDGRKWNNVISHLALTTRPRITKQAPFGSIAAAMSMASDVKVVPTTPGPVKEGFCLSKAGRLGTRKKSRRLCPYYPIAFSLFSGAALAEGDIPPKKRPPPGGADEDTFEDELETGGEGGDGGEGEMPPEGESTPELEPFKDPAGDVSMEELLCDLLSALGIHCEKSANEDAFKRSLYNAAMTKIHELTGKGLEGDANQPLTGQGNQAPPNPLIQQEQQPMYMSLDEINKLPDPMKGVALAMYAENQKLRAEVDANAKVANSLRDAKLKEASVTRLARVALLGKLSPRVRADLDAMVAVPSMALSMGDGGTVVDPMAQTLAVLEKGLADMPRLLTTEASAFAVQAQPTDAEMSQDAIDKAADDYARAMGAPPEQKKAS